MWIPWRMKLLWWISVLDFLWPFLVYPQASLILFTTLDQNRWYYFSTQISCRNVEVHHFSGKQCTVKLKDKILTCFLFNLPPLFFLKINFNFLQLNIMIKTECQYLHLLSCGVHAQKPHTTINHVTCRC